MVFVVTSWCFTQKSNSKHLLSLQLPTPCLPSTPFHATESWLKPALKSPKVLVLSSTVGSSNKNAQIRVKFVLFCWIDLKSFGVHSEKIGSSLITQWETHRDDVVRIPFWQVFKLGSNEISDHEAHVILLLICLTSKGNIWCRALLGCFPMKEGLLEEQWCQHSVLTVLEQLKRKDVLDDRCRLCLIYFWCSCMLYLVLSHLYRWLCIKNYF